MYDVDITLEELISLGVVKTKTIDECLKEYEEEEEEYGMDIPEYVRISKGA